MAISLHDLAGADPDLRFSPYCWSVKFALAHKGLTATTIPWRFTKKADIAGSGGATVPVIRDGARALGGSWAIAVYLEDTYPGPALFGSDTARAHAAFIRAWADAVMVAGIARCIILDLWNIIHAKDKTYFRQTREAWLGGTPEAVQADRDAHVAALPLRAGLAPVRTVLRRRPFLGGAGPSYADYVVAGMLMWPLCASRFPMLGPMTRSGIGSGGCGICTGAWGGWRKRSDRSGVYPSEPTGAIHRDHEITDFPDFCYL